MVFESVRPNNYACYTSFNMRQFIGSYIKNRTKSMLNTDGDRNYELSPAESNTVVKRLLDIEAQYYTFAELLWQKIGAGQIEKSIELFSWFKKDFPDTDLTHHFDKILGNLSLLMAGNKAPDFQVEDEDGELINLNDYKGKWVCFMFVSADSDPKLSVIKSLGNYSKFMNNKRFMPLLILTDKKADRETIREIKKYYSGTIAFNPDWKYPSTQIYHVSYRTGSFLINPEELMEYPWFWLPIDQKEIHYKNATDRLKRYMDSKEESVVTLKSKTLFLIIGITLASVIVLFIAFFIWRYRLKQKAEEKQEKRFGTTMGNSGK